MSGSSKNKRPFLVVLIRLLAASSLVVLMLVASPVPTAEAQPAEGLMISAATTFTPDPANERIDVQATYVMTNVQRDEVVDGLVRSFFFTKWVIAMPANATDFAATSDGRRLATQIKDDPESTGDASKTDVVFGSIDLPFNLNFEQSVTLDVSYTIASGAPRAEGPRINNSFLSFSVWTPGNPGMADVRIAIPAGFTMEVQGDLTGLEEVERDGLRVLEATEIGDPRAFFGQVFGRNDTGLITDWAELPNAQATVRAWPDDPEWAEFVIEAIENDVPVIEDLTGLEWPAGNIQVIETVTPYLYGYGGWFNASSGLIEIGDKLERDLILHELAHAWFNEDLIEGRWITEGLAEEFASRAIAATSATQIEPPLPDQLDPETPSLDDPLRVQLADWGSPWTLREEDAYDYEQFHYNTSWWVIRQITDDVGLEAFSDVLLALQNNETAYLGEGPAEQTTTPTRWTHFFDLLEHRAGASDLDELFVTYVLSTDDASKLADRQHTVDNYHDLVDDADSWAPPLVVRRALSAWHFDDAEKHISEALAIIQLRDQVDQHAAELAVRIEHRAEVPFETASSATDLAEALAMVQQLETDLAALAEDRANLEQRSEAMRTTTEFQPMTLAQAQSGVLTQGTAISTVSELRRQVEARANDLGVLAPPWPVSSGATDFDAATSLAQARLATLDALENATATTKADRSVAQRVGLWGSDADQTLVTARSAFEADDLDDSLAAAGDTELMLAQAAATGWRRLLYASIITLAIVFTLAAFNRV